VDAGLRGEHSYELAGRLDLGDPRRAVEGQAELL
jgi:hypothetical protein